MANKSSVLFSSDPAQPVPIAIGQEPGTLAAVEPCTIGQMFRRSRDSYSNMTAMAVKVGDTWNKITYSEYYRLCVRAAKSFLKLGLEPLHGVAVIGFNSPEWAISTVGTIFAGGLASGIYATSSPEACQYIANDCRANIVVVENDKQLQKFLKIREALPHLKAIVQYKGEVSSSYPSVYDWDTFLTQGDDTDDQIVEDLISAQKPESCTSLIYTSGTTGDPKGVMLTHDNITWTLQSIDASLKALQAGDTIVSYLPLNHIAGQLVDIYWPLLKGVTIYFAQPDALKGSLKDTLREVQPHLFLGVPRVWEKFMEALVPMLPPPGSGPPLTDEIVKAIKAKILAGLGLTRCQTFITAAAPISMEVLQFFAKFGIDIIEVWGMSETSGPGTCCTKTLPDQWKPGSLGKPFVGMEIKIDCPDPNTGEGEICLHGRNVMMGYLNKPEKTAEIFDTEGWLHSGDVGRIDEDGFLYITGRIKELIITSGGKNIAPVPIEDLIKKHAPFLSNVVLIGDRRKYLSCLVTLKCDMNPATGGPTDQLTAEALQLLTQLGSNATTVSGVIDTKDRAVYNAIQQAIDTANESAPSHVEKVQKFIILKEDLSIPGGELGPTLKLKRFYVLSKYADIIDQIYSV